MSRSSSRKRRHVPRRQVLSYVGLGLLAVATAGVVGFAFLTPAPPVAVPDKVNSYYSATPTARPEADLVTIIGDSYTGGSDMGGNKAANWVALVQKTTDTANLANNGMGGTGYATAGDNFATRVPTTVFPSTDLVVFFGSRNDIVNTPKAVGTNAASAYAQVHKIAPKAKLLVIGPAWGGSDIPDEMLPIRDAIKEAATAAGATFVDPFEEQWFLDSPEAKAMIGDDGVHPTDAGHAFLAKKIGPKITAALAK